MTAREPQHEEHYSTRLRPISLTREEAQLWTTITRHRESRLCKLDGRLIEAARRHVAELLDSPSARGVSPIDHLRFALRFNGSPEYMITPIVEDHTPSGIDAILRFAHSRQEDISHCGIAVVSREDQAIAIFLGARKVVDISPLPVQVETGTVTVFRGSLVDPKARHLRAFMETPNGRVTQLRVSLMAGRFFNIPLSFPDPGRYLIELQANLGGGPETISLIPIFVGVPVETHPTVVPDFGEPDPHPLETMTTLINNVRRSAGLHPLQRDRRLDQVAQAHCQDMVSLNHFGHYSSASGMLENRLASKGFHPKEMAENIARSNSAVRIHHNLMKSPSHKIKLLNPDFTHLGLGVAQDEADLIITQIFARW